MRAYLALALPLFALASWGLDLGDVARADAIAVGTISAAPPDVVTLDVRMSDGTLRVDLLPHIRLAIYSVDYVRSIKGGLPTSLKVLADAPQDQTRVGTFGGSSGKAPQPLPAGRPVLIFLQAAYDGKFQINKCSVGPGFDESGQYVSAPDGVSYGVFELAARPGYIALTTDTVVLKGDAVAYDVARAMLAAAPSGSTIPVGFPGLAGTLCLAPGVGTLDGVKASPSSFQQYVPCLRVIGTDPLGFLKKEILPSLPPPADQVDQMARLRLLGSWGSPDAAAGIGDLILGLGNPGDTRVRSAMERLATDVRYYRNGVDATIRLLGSADDEVVIAALSTLESPACRRYDSNVSALLDSADQEVVWAAMRTLSRMHCDPAHEPRYGDKSFDSGSQNSTLLQYWKAKH